MCTSRQITNALRRRLFAKSRSEIRSMMRGYRYLKQSNQLHIIEDLIQFLRDQPLHDVLATRNIPLVIWGKALTSAELIIRQRLSLKYLDIHKALLIASSYQGGKVAAPIPHVWRRHIENNGFLVNHKLCERLWKVELIKQSLYGMAEAIISITKVYHGLLFTLVRNEPYIYFCDLISSNLPQNHFPYKSYCILNWYIYGGISKPNSKIIKHSVKDRGDLPDGNFTITYQACPVPNILTARNALKYTLNLCRQFIIIIHSLIQNKWWNILIYREAVVSLRTRHIEPNLLAKEYWFHNSQAYPPLWTHELSAKGIQIIYYFYSTNCDPFPREDGSRPFITLYSIMNWPTIYVWNSLQADFIRKTKSCSSQIVECGPIWFTDSVQFEPSGEQYIAAFDVQPMRSSRYANLCTAQDYYNPKNSIKFIQDIVESANDLGIVVCFKRKRDIGTLVHPLYRNFLNTLKNFSNIRIVDPGVSAFKLIEHSSGVVSMPFTSTALIASAQGKASLYYDPKILFSATDPAASDVPIVNQKRFLKEWMIKLKNSNQASTCYNTDKISY